MITTHDGDRVEARSVKKLSGKNILCDILFEIAQFSQQNLLLLFAINIFVQSRSNRLDSRV